MPFASCTLHQRSATRVRNLRHSNVGCAWRLAEPNPRLWRVVNALFSVSLAADLGAAGACPTGRRPGPQPAVWSGPLPGRVGSCLRWQRPAAGESADPGRPGRHAAGRVGGPRTVESASARSNRPSPCGRTGRQAAESASGRCCRAGDAACVPTAEWARGGCAATTGAIVPPGAPAASTACGQRSINALRK